VYITYSRPLHYLRHREDRAQRQGFFFRRAGNRYASQIMDAIDIVIDPVLFYNQLANAAHCDKLYTKAGAFIGGDGPPQEWGHGHAPDLAGLSPAAGD